MNEELAVFAEEVRRAALQIVGAAGGAGRAAELALFLCDRAAAVRQGELMKLEQSEPDRFSLAALRVDLRSAAPECDED